MKTFRLTVTTAATAALLTSAALAVAPIASAQGRHHHHPPELPAAATVVLTPAQRQVTITATGDPYFPTRATLGWTVPACTGTVYAYFQLNQDAGRGPVYVQEKGATAYPCTSTTQVVTVTYKGASPAQGALHPGTVDLTTQTWAQATGSTVLKTTGVRLPAASA